MDCSTNEENLYQTEENDGTKKKSVEDADDESKMFIGGLSWETSVDEFRNYFEQFGPVIDCTIKTDPNTGRSRGFGFVLFADGSSVDKVIAAGTHSISGKNIDPKRAKPRGPEPVKKVFIGGLDTNTTEDEIREYFGKYGNIEELTLPVDKITNARKPFAFISFDSEVTVEQLCAISKHTIGSKQVEVKKAVPKSELNSGGGMRGGFGGRGGRGDFGGGRGRGGRGGMGRGGSSNGGYGQNSWDSSGYGAQGSYGPYGSYTGSYDYGAYGQSGGNYGQSGGYGQSSGYGQTGSYGQTNSYGNQQYPGYDYSGWYGQQSQPANAQAAGSGYGRAGRGGAYDARYQPYSR